MSGERDKAPGSRERGATAPAEEPQGFFDGPAGMMRMAQANRIHRQRIMRKKDETAAGDKGPAKRDPKDPVFLQAKARSAPVAAKLQAALMPEQKGRVTMGAGVTDGGRLIIGSSEGAYLRPSVAKVAKETGGEIAKGSGHAEDNIIGHAGKGLVAVAAGRPICETCEGNILTAGALPASACKSGRTY